MSYTLLRECSVVVLYDGKRYQFDAFSDLSFGQTFKRKTDARKTLHQKKAKPNTIMSSKNPANVNLKVLCTDSFSERVFLSLIGLEYRGHYDYRYPDVIPIQPQQCEIYVVTKQEVIKISPAVLESLDIPLSITEANYFDLSFSAGNIESTQHFPAGEGLYLQGEVPALTPIQYKVGHLLNNSILTATVSIKQDVTWRQDRGLHNIGSLYTATKPFLTNMSISATASTYLKGSSASAAKPIVTNLEVAQSAIFVKFTDILLSKRIEPQDVFNENVDIALTEQSEVLIEYGGLIS